MGDSGATGAQTRRRRGTLGMGRTASMVTLNGKSAAACQSSLTANTGSVGGQGQRDRSLEAALTKSEKKRRGNDLSDRLRWVTARMSVLEFEDW